MMHQPCQRLMLVSQWELLEQILLKELQTSSCWMITSSLLLSLSDMEEMFMTTLESSCNSNCLLMSLLCSLFSSALLFWRAPHWMQFKCSGSTLLWILSEPSLLQLNHLLRIFYWENHIIRTRQLLQKSCREMFLVMVSTKWFAYALSFLPHQDGCAKTTGINVLQAQPKMVTVNGIHSM